MRNPKSAVRKSSGETGLSSTGTRPTHCRISGLLAVMTTNGMLRSSKHRMIGSLFPSLSVVDNGRIDSIAREKVESGAIR